jgi:hypothetical protein
MNSICRGKPIDGGGMAPGDAATVAASIGAPAHQRRKAGA